MSGPSSAEGHSARLAGAPRTGAAMTYDQGQRRIVLFGGEDAAGIFMNDTWTWDGTTWTQMHPGHPPSARAYAAMAWRDRREVILFGGFGPNGYLSDTWLW